MAAGWGVVNQAEDVAAPLRGAEVSAGRDSQRNGALNPDILIAIEADGLVGDAWVPGVEGPPHSGGPSYVLLLLLLSITA